MAETYSLGTLGARADQHQNVATVTIGDSAVNAPGAEEQAQRLGTQVLCKGPDGQLSWQVYDAERSLPGSMRTLKRVAP